MSGLTSARMSYAAALVAWCYFILAAVCVHFLLQKRRHTSNSHRIVLGYMSFMLAVNTTYFVAGSKWSEIEFVERIEDPGLFAAQHSSTYAIIKGAMYILNIWLADSLMIYRAYIIWSSCRVLAFPVVIYLGSIASGLGLLIAMSEPGGTFGVGLVGPFGTAFLSISVALNVVLTSLISYKLLRQRHRLRTLRVTCEAGDTYTDIVAILVESAALYSVAGLIYIPLFALNLPLQYPFSTLFASAAGIAPNLIVFRIALGVEFKGDTEADPSSVQFAHDHTFTTNSIIPPTTSYETAVHQTSVRGSTKASRVLGDTSPNWEKKDNAR